MTYRMTIIDSPAGDLRPRYRGTGFCLKPGGMTTISPPGWTFDEYGTLRAKPKHPLKRLARYWVTRFNEAGKPIWI